MVGGVFRVGRVRFDQLGFISYRAFFVCGCAPLTGGILDVSFSFTMTYNVPLIKGFFVVMGPLGLSVLLCVLRVWP